MIYSSKNFCANSLALLNNLRKKNESCDVVIKVNRVNYAAHKAILIAGSPLLRQHFSKNGGSTFVVGIKVTNTRVVEDVLNFLYVGEISFTNEKLAEIMLLGTYLQITEIQTFAANFMQNMHSTSDNSARVGNNEVALIEVHTYDEEDESREMAGSADDDMDIDNNNFTSKESKVDKEDIKTDITPVKESYNVLNKGGHVVFQCTVCNHPFNSKNNCMRHMSTHTGHKPFICDQCGRAFPRKDTLQKHYGSRSCMQYKDYNQKKKHDKGEHKEKVHTAEIDNLQLSVYLDSSAPSNKFRCKECGEVSSSKANFRRHIRLHTGYKPYRCKNCLKYFSRKDYLHRHQLRWKNSCKLVKQTQSTDNFSLLSIGYSPKNTSNSTEDSEKEVNGENGFFPFTCKDCDVNFDSFESFSLHRKEDHDVIEEIQCPVCQLLFSNEFFLAKHLTYHEKQQQSSLKKTKLYKCVLCTEIFKDMDAFQKHDLVGCATQCRFCSLSFRSKAHLERHVRTHIKENLFVCNICQRSFRVREKLTAHLELIHDLEMPKYVRMGGVPQIVEVEGMQEDNNDESTMETNLTEKEDEPSEGSDTDDGGKKNFLKCSLCDSKFKKKSGLEKHMNNVHSATVPAVGIEVEA